MANGLHLYATVFFFITLLLCPVRRNTRFVGCGFCVSLELDVGQGTGSNVMWGAVSRSQAQKLENMFEQVEANMKRI